MVLARQRQRFEWIRGLVDFVFPPLCLACNEFTESRYQICDQCRRSIDEFNHPICLSCFALLPSERACPTCKGTWLPLFVFGNYGGSLREIVIQFKFHGITSVAEFLADELVRIYDDRISKLGATHLVPVPLHPKRESERGYNQAALLAHAIGDRMAIPVAEDIIFRSGARRHQTELNFAKRAENIGGAFESPPSDDTERTIMLVDDVVTSGATISEARKTLRAAGYTVIGAISGAHGR